MELYFTRHAESLENIGISLVDSPLSDRGRDQARSLGGYYDLVIISPLRRCLETLHYSKIKYARLEICQTFREIRRSEESEMLLEDPIRETMEEFKDRIGRFDEWFRETIKSYPTGEDEDVLKVLLIGHGMFFHLWNRSDGPDMPENAEIFRLIHAEDKY